MSRVAIAITTFNSAAYIASLLIYALEQHPYKVYVLDDASSDNTVSVCQQFRGVEVIAGHKNVGPVRNRNRILGHDIGDILVFLDDDMQWRSGNLLETITKHFAAPDLGVLGFAIFDSVNNKELWFSNERESNPLFAWALRPFITRLSEAERRTSLLTVQWVLEGAFAIRSGVFASLNGFDERFKRYQEGPDLCRRVRQRKLRIGYTHDMQFVHSKPLSVFSAQSRRSLSPVSNPLAPYPLG